MDTPAPIRGPRVKREVPWINTGKVKIGYTYTPPPAPMSRDAEILQAALLKAHYPTLRTRFMPVPLFLLLLVIALIALLF